MKLVFATGNLGKLREAAEILGPDFELLTPADLGITEEIPETGNTFRANSLQKAEYIRLRTGLDCFADDSGLEVDALGGAPGIYSARFAGSHGDDKANNELLLRKLQGVPKEKRTARYAVAIACVLPDGETFTVRGTTEGLILDSYDGAGGFGYDPLFWSLDLQKSFGRATPEEKNGVSHRGRAVRLAASELIRRLQTQNERNIK